MIYDKLLCSSENFSQMSVLEKPCYFPLKVSGNKVRSKTETRKSLILKVHVYTYVLSYIYFLYITLYALYQRCFRFIF